MSPDEHMAEAERLLEVVVDGTGNEWCQMMVKAANAYATLALAGYTRDAATGANHVHKFLLPTHPLDAFQTGEVCPMTEPLDLDALAALEAAATPGPWFWRERGVERRFGDTFGMALNLTADNTIPGVPPPFNVGHPLNIIKADNRGVTWAPSDEDAGLMVEARNALPDLIDRVRVAEARLDAVRALHHPIQKVTSASSQITRQHMTVTRCSCSPDSVIPCRTLAALDGDG